MRIAIAVLAVALLSACERTPDMTPIDPSRPASNQENPTYARPADPDRFSVVRAMTFKDELAYGDKRGVYIITDRKTGTEFVGISGIGIADTGNHRSGKSTATDER